MIKMGSKILVAILLCCATEAQAGGLVNPGETRMFTEADRCEGTPFLDTPLKGTNSFCDPASGRAEAAALLSVAAVNSDVSAFSKVITDFSVLSNSEAVLDATVSAEVEWNGALFGAGILGAGASVDIEMFLRDNDTGAITGQITIVSKSQDSTGLKGIDVGGTKFSGNREVTFLGKVVRGHNHSIELKVTCNAESGLVGLDVGCIFQNNVFGLGLGDRFVKWNTLFITVEQDINERFNRLDSIQIQEHLVSCNPIVDLFLPAKFGGRLEEVFSNVEDSIVQASDAGIDTRKANKKFLKAESKFAKDEYLEAYENLCRAHNSLNDDDDD